MSKVLKSIVYSIIQNITSIKASIVKFRLMTYIYIECSVSAILLDDKPSRIWFQYKLSAYVGNCDWEVCV